MSQYEYEEAMMMYNNNASQSPQVENVDAVQWAQDLLKQGSRMSLPSFLRQTGNNDSHNGDTTENEKYSVDSPNKQNRFSNQSHQDEGELYRNERGAIDSPGREVSMPTYNNNKK